MGERPILFSGPMVRALLDGTKTQTRRLVKPQPPAGHNFAGFTTWSTHRADEGKAVWGAGDVRAMLHDAHRARCPFGRPGDTLWVRETWARDDEDGSLLYRADVGKGGDADDWERNRTEGVARCRWRPSIHMPRSASRITLEITDVRVERLQEISYEDALAEGMRDPGMTPPFPWPSDETPTEFARRTRYPQRSFAELWESLNGPGSWAANPWCWAISFRRVTP
jgi:hypothetical protein